MDGGACWAAVHGVSAKSRIRISDFTFTFHFHALEKEMATHSSVLAWRIPGTGEPGGLPSMGSHRVRHDWSDLAAAAAVPPLRLSSDVNDRRLKFSHLKQAVISYLVCRTCQSKIYSPVIQLLLTENIPCSDVDSFFFFLKFLVGEYCLTMLWWSLPYINTNQS